MAKTHKDVEFHVDGPNETTDVFDTIDEAAVKAFQRAFSSGKCVIDIVVMSAKGARWLEGEDGVAHYKDDPEASVYRRIVVKVDDQGRVP